MTQLYFHPGQEAFHLGQMSKSQQTYHHLSNKQHLVQRDKYKKKSENVTEWKSNLGPTNALGSQEQWQRRCTPEGVTKRKNVVGEENISSSVLSFTNIW